MCHGNSNEKREKANRASEFWKKRCDLCPANLAWNITTKKKQKQKQKNKTKTKKQNKNKKQNKIKQKTNKRTNNLKKEAFYFSLNFILPL